MAYQAWIRGLTRTNFSVGHKRIGLTPQLVDLDNGNVRRTLQNERGRYLILPDLNWTLYKSGAIANTGLTTATGLVIRFPRACKVMGIVASLGTAVATASIIIDAKKVAAGGQATAAGTTIFTTTGNRPTITIGNTTSTLAATWPTLGAGIPDVQDFAAGDLLRFEVPSGSFTAAADLVIQVFGV